MEVAEGRRWQRGGGGKGAEVTEGGCGRGGGGGRAKGGKGV